MGKRIKIILPVLFVLFGMVFPTEIFENNSASSDEDVSMYEDCGEPGNCIWLDPDLGYATAENEGDLLLREDYSFLSDVSGKLRRNAVVEILCKTHRYETIRGIRAEWWLVRSDEDDVCGFYWSGYLDSDLGGSW